MRRAILGLFCVLPSTAVIAASLQPLYGPPGGDLSAAAADNRISEWADQVLSQGLTPATAASSPAPVQASAAPTQTSPVSDVQTAAPATEAPSSGATVRAADPGTTRALGVAALNGITIIGRRDPLQKSDQRLKRTIDALPGLGVGGRVVDETPLAITIGKQVALSAARQLLFHQPHVRGEAMDEALYQAQSGVCTADAPFRCLASDKQP